MNDPQDVGLADVVTLQRGHDLPSKSRGAGTVPIIGSFGITGFHDVARYRGPGVAIGRSGASIGVATYCPDDYWPLNTCLFVKDFKGNDPRWVYYLLDFIDFSGYNSGSAQPSLNRNYLAKIRVRLPEPEEQRRIAATLGGLDNSIESNRRAIDLTAQLLDALAAKVALDLPATSLGALVTVSRDTINPTQLGDEIVDHYSLPAFDEGARPQRVPATRIMSNKLVIAKRSILLSRLNPRFNRTWLVTPDATIRALASTEFLCLTASDDEALAAVWLALRDEYFRSELPRRVTGTSGSHQRVRPDDALAIEVPDVAKLPAETKRAALAALESIEQKRHEIARVTKLRDTLLPELISGRIRVPEADRTLEGVVA